MLLKSLPPYVTWLLGGCKVAPSVGRIVNLGIGDQAGKIVVPSSTWATSQASDD